MPKTAYLAKHFSSEELKEKYLKSQNSVEMRRWHLLWKISLGWTIKNSAIAVGCSYPYAQKILSQYNLHGEEGIKNRKNQTSNHVRGKKRLLSQPQLEKLTRAIAQKSPDGGIWTGTKVARWIEKETGREKVWNQRRWDYLKKCGYSWQSPRPTHKKANKLEQEMFKNNLPLKLKKLEQKNPDVEVELWFFDEHRVGLKPILKKVWSKVGHRPEAIVQHRYEWLYVYGFVKPKTGETLWYLIPRVNTNWLNLVYQQAEQSFNELDSFSMWPYVYSQSSVYSISVEDERIPPGEIAVRRGADVEATDGHVGKVCEFVIDPTDGHITHLVLREGHLWSEKELILSLSAVDRMDEDAVYLNLNQKTVKSLPAIPVKRFYRTTQSPPN